MFEFNEERHIYTLNGKPLTGCTTVLGCIAKPALIQWAADMACDYILENSEVGNRDDEIIYKVSEKTIKEAKTAHRKKKEDTADIGTSVHKYIENWIKTGETPQGNEMEMKMFNNFKGWAETNKVKFLQSELKMYSREKWVAGTVDFLCEIDGKKYVGDIKTTSGIYDRTPFAQTACYQMMLEEQGEKDIVGRIIINIKKTGEFNEDKDVYLSEHYEDDLNLFLSALSIYRIMGSFEPLVNKFKK